MADRAGRGHGCCTRHPERRVRWDALPARRRGDADRAQSDHRRHLARREHQPRARADPARLEHGRLHHRGSAVHQRHEGERQGRALARARGWRRDPDRSHRLPLRMEGLTLPRVAMRAGLLHARAGASAPRCVRRRKIMGLHSHTFWTRSSIATAALTLLLLGAGCATSPKPQPEPSPDLAVYKVGAPDALVVTILPDPIVTETAVVR